MQAISFSELRKDMKTIMDQVHDRHEPTIITRKQGHMVLMSLTDFNAFAETAYILGNPHNARRVLESINTIKLGHVEERTLIDVDN